MPPFFTDDDWRTVSEFEAILRYTSQLILVCQNEEKLNVSHGPVMQKSLHDSLLKETMELISTEQRSSDKHMTCPTRSEVNVNSFAEAGKACKKRAFLEFERRFFNNKSETTFADAKYDFCMHLSNRERSLLVLDKRFCWSRSVFENVHE